MGEPEYIELNMCNYNDDDVAHLNEWGIWAAGEIERLRLSRDREKAINAQNDGLMLARQNQIDKLQAENEWLREELKQLHNHIGMRIELDEN